MEVQDYLAELQISTVEELTSFMSKRRNAAVIPMKRNVDGSCCRVENPSRVPHDLSITLDCIGDEQVPPSIVMLYRPESSRGSICWKKREDGGYCSGKPGRTPDLSCGAHPLNTKISYIPLAPNAKSLSDNDEEEVATELNKRKPYNRKWEKVPKKGKGKRSEPIDESKKKEGSSSVQYASSLPKSDLVGLMGPGYFETLQQGLIQIAFSSAIKAALEHYGRRSEYDVDDLKLPVSKHIHIPDLKRFLGERVWSHRYISLSYEPHEDGFLVKSGDDGDWEMICREESCLSIAEGVRGPHCRSHKVGVTREEQQEGLQAAVLKLLCRAAGVTNSVELMRSQEGLERLSRRLSENKKGNKKLDGVFGDWSFSIYLATNGYGSQIIAVDKVRSGAPVQLQLCEEEACLELYYRTLDNCPRCYPSNDYVVCVFKSEEGDEYYIGTAAGASDLSNINSFNNSKVEGKSMKADSKWKNVKTIEGYYSEDEANSIVIAGHIALLIESLVFEQDVKIVRKRVKLGSLIYHFLQYLLGQAGLQLVVRKEIQAELIGSNGPPPSWMSYENRSERKEGEGVIYECHSEKLKTVYVGKTSGPGTEPIAAYHNVGQGEDGSKLKILRKHGKTIDKVVASIDGLTELLKGYAPYNEHLEKAETVVMLSRSLVAGGPFKNTDCKGIVNAFTSDLTTNTPREFLYQLMNTLLQHYGECLSWEPCHVGEADGNKIKPYLLQM